MFFVPSNHSSLASLSAAAAVSYRIQQDMADRQAEIDAIRSGENMLEWHKKRAESRRPPTANETRLSEIKDQRRMQLALITRRAAAASAAAAGYVWRLVVILSSLAQNQIAFSLINAFHNIRPNPPPRTTALCNGRDRAPVPCRPPPPRSLRTPITTR